ncbi:hypothetical protein [Gryllotalpicola reticulitermitis]|uniref:hypothetical protein n=1 Tax=Gryllotalpicola reticulitermitis TaxID=1184153 RepID=UPI0036F19E6E
MVVVAVALIIVAGLILVGGPVVGAVFLCRALVRAQRRRLDYEYRRRAEITRQVWSSAPPRGPRDW